jgi:hypothetical protein
VARNLQNLFFFLIVRISSHVDNKAVFFFHFSLKASELLVESERVVGSNAIESELFVSKRKSKL